MPARRLVRTVLVAAFVLASCAESDIAAPPPTSSPASSPADDSPPTTPATLPSVVVAGDSIIHDVAPAVEAALEPAAAAVLSVLSPSLGDPANRETLLRSAARARADVVVVMVGVWERFHTTEAGLQIGDAGFVEAYTSEVLEPLAAALDRDGRRLLILGPPVLKVPEDQAVVAELEAIWSAYAAATATVHFVDSDRWLGDAGYAELAPVSGERLRRLDGLHLCAAGAARITEGLISEVAAVLGTAGVTPSTDWERGSWTGRFPEDECPPSP